MSFAFEPTRDAALARLADFVPRAGRAYQSNRNMDDGRRAHVSALSPWLHAQLIDEREVLEAVLADHSRNDAYKFVSEVFWRVYFKGYLEQRPTIWRAFCEKRDAALADPPDGYKKACAGETGIEAFDHWARELVETGWLHNHARMWFASIWIFTLKLDWTLGADFFLRHLVDADAASNSLSWRWVAGLHTKGKTYLARPGNIARYTAEREGGPFAAEGLATRAEALSEERSHERQPLNLPDPVAPAAPYALLLHDEAASHVPLGLDAPPALVIGASRPAARSPSETGDIAKAFADDAVANGVAAAAEAFDCASAAWNEGETLREIMADSGAERLLVPYLPVGWTRDALIGEVEALDLPVDWHVALLVRAAWPAATAGFFGVKKKMGAAMDAVGL